MGPWERRSYTDLSCLKDNAESVESVSVSLKEGNQRLVHLGQREIPLVLLAFSSLPYLIREAFCLAMTP